MQLPIFVTTPVARAAIALGLPFVVTGIQWLCWDAIRPYAWFFYFPTVFVSAWIGSLRAGVIAAISSALLARFFFMSPVFSLAIADPMQAINMAMFVVMGILYAYFFERFRKQLQYREQARSAEELQRSAARLRRLAEVVEQIAAVRDLRALMTIVRQAVRELTGADGATLVLLDNGYCHYADEDAIGPLWKGQRFPLETCISGWAMLHARQVVIEDIYEDPRIPHEAYRPTFVKSLSMVPVGRKQPVAAIGCYWATRHRATAEELELQQALADAMSVGLANLDLYGKMEEARRVAQQNADEARASTVRFEATFEQAAVGIALVSPDGHWLRVNRKLCEIVGYSPAELVDKTFQAITHPDDLYTDLTFMRQMLAQEIETYSLEKRYIRKDGRTIWINLTVSLVWKPDNSPDYFISVIEDIETRKSAEAALKEAKRLGRLGYWKWDLVTDTHSWSDEVYQIYGRDAALPPAVYPEVQRYFTSQSWNDLVKVVERAVRDGVGYECDAEVVRSDGSHCWVIARGEAIRAADGTIAALYGTVQDITERKKAEEEIRQLNATLERRVEERTTELEIANRELDAFAYAVSHDLRAPLRAMSGFSQALVEDYGPQLQGEAFSYLQEICQSARHMGELIDALLHLSRVTRGEVQREQIDLSALSAGISDELSLQEPGCQLVCSIEPGMSICADPRMIEMVMRNLLGNAWKYTGRAINPEVRVYHEEQDGTVWFCVADNGAGFDMQFADRLFKPFQRLHRQDEFPGIGIGLTTVQRIIHRHGGRIKAQSEPGVGTTFRFTLPEREGEAAA